MPDATLLLISCQHAPFLEAAIHSLLHQRDIRLRLVLSDDASTDASWEIIQRLADGHRGPHRVETRRNAVRLGVAGHLNELMREVDTTLVILAASDDVSQPNRAARLLEAWRAAGEPKAYLTSDARFLDEFGQLGELLHARPPARTLPLAQLATAMGGEVLECTGAFHRDIWEEFGPFRVTRQVEDRPLAFRAAGMDGILHIAEPLVNYRVHGSNLSQNNTLPGYADTRRQRLCDFETQIYGQILADLDHPLFTSRHGPAAVAAARRAAQRGVERAQFGLEYLMARGWRRGTVIGRTILHGQSPRRLLRWSWETLTRPQAAASAPKT